MIRLLATTMAGRSSSRGGRKGVRGRGNRGKSVHVKEKEGGPVVPRSGSSANALENLDDSIQSRYHCLIPTFIV